MGRRGFAIKILQKSTPVAYYQGMEIIERRLSVAIDVRDDSFEYRWILTRLRPKLCIQVLQLELLPPEIVRETTEFGSLIFFSFLVVESI